MAVARVFRSGSRQAVLLPKSFRFASKEVEIFRRGDEIVLRERKKGLERAFEILASLPDDVLSEPRRDTPPRSGFDSVRGSTPFRLTSIQFHRFHQPTGTARDWLKISRQPMFAA